MPVTVSRSLRDIAAADLTAEKAAEFAELFNDRRGNTHLISEKAWELRSRHFKNGEYDRSFRDWVKRYRVGLTFGRFPNFTKYAMAGGVIMMAKKRKFFDLNRLPAKRSPLYEASKLDEGDLEALFAEPTEGNTSLVMNRDLTARQVASYRKQCEQLRIDPNAVTEPNQEPQLLAKIMIDPTMLAISVNEEKSQLTTMLEAVASALKPFTFASIEMVRLRQKRSKNRLKGVQQSKAA